MSALPPTADQLPEELLRAAGLQDTARARRLLVGLAGQGVTDEDVALLLPSLLDAVGDCPDPDRSLGNFVRWAEALVNRSTHFRYLLTHPAGLRILFAVGAASQYLADLLARDPEYVEILTNPGVRSGARPPDQVLRELSGLVKRIATPSLQLDAMRRFRQREYLRIAARDILGLADMPTTALEFSNLADACIQICVELASEEAHHRYPDRTLPGMAVIALGKLGGRELNYSSDIDLIFVCDDLQDSDAGAIELELVTFVAEKVVAFLSRDTSQGHLFRVDVRLRPEGRFGALVRSLSSYRAYYESWAETWERQAMLKARTVAGDRRIGHAFVNSLAPFTYPRVMTGTMIEEIRANKRRMEAPALKSGEPSANVKIGIGGIRDIEFAVQYLQMRHGSTDPMVRTVGTLPAIARLRQSRFLSDLDARRLTDGYIFLRTVEHRLQLLYDRQTQSLPPRGRERDLLARRLGFADSNAFHAEYDRVCAEVRSIHEHILGIEPNDTSTYPDVSWTGLLAAPEDSRSMAELEEQLRAEGFHDPEQAVRTIKISLLGTGHGREAPDAAAAFRKLAERLIPACAASGDPDAALSGISLLAEANPNRAEWYSALEHSPDLMRRLVRLAAASVPMISTLARRLEWIDLLVSEVISDPEAKPIEVTSAELQERLPAHSDAPELDSLSFWDALATYLHRERLRIGARDIWGEADVETIALELTRLSEVALSTILDHCVRTLPNSASAPPIAIIGLGKFGGMELSYGSDLDLLFVLADEAADRAEGTASTAGGRLGSALAEAVIDSTRFLRQRGLPFVLDPRLRPDGRFGAVAMSVAQLQQYYESRAEMWERQALIKARLVAGSEELGANVVEILRRAVYCSPFTQEHDAAVRAMKTRIESERLKRGEEYSDLKLGHGGLSDCEFVTQLYQLRFGPEHPSARAVGTTQALDALACVGGLPPSDAARFVENYRYLGRVRNRLALIAGQPIDTLPSDRQRLRALAIGLGVLDSGAIRAEEGLIAEIRERMQETRRLFELRFTADTARSVNA